MSIRRMFEKIDASGKGHITEDDLQQYADARGLPSAYVRPFMEALTARAPGESEETASDGGEEVGFRRFRRFVVSRENGLRDAFDMFDKDHDGVISYEDLDLSLQHVAICCPQSRCIVRCRQQVVSELMRRVDADGSSTVSFEEFRNYFTLLPQNDASVIAEYWLGASLSGSCADTGTRVVVQEAHRRGSPWGHLFAGAVAGGISRTATAPLETLRLAAMAGGVPPGTRLDTMAAALVADHGWRALYRGNAVNVMRSAPQKALDFFAFDCYKALLARPRHPSPSSSPSQGAAAAAPAAAAGGPSLPQTFLAAGLAGATSCLLLYPLDVARMRMTLDTTGRYRGALHCLRALVDAEGPAALFRGLGPSLAAIFPEAAITYGLHDLLKRGYRRVRHRDPGIGPSLAAGVLSASMGQLVAYPLETISRRMQLGGLSPAHATGAASASSGGAAAAASVATAGRRGGAGAWHVASQLVREGGVRSLYAGIGAATLRLVPMAVVSFGVYELMRVLLLQAEVRWDRTVADWQHQQLHKGTRQAAALGCGAPQPCGGGAGCSPQQPCGPQLAVAALHLDDASGQERQQGRHAHPEHQQRSADRVSHQQQQQPRPQGQSQCSNMCDTHSGA